jgi:inorganic triphosphatase YgiF
VEIELKFQVPAGRRAALQRAVATPSARVTRLQAIYVDTADRRLAAAGLALRLREEGRTWVQTLKGRGDGLAHRLEHEVRLPARAGTPVIDPSRHAGSAVGAQLQAALRAGGGAPAELVEVLRTDIRRTHRRVASGGAVIEIALDAGELLAGGRRATVHEIEFELISGPPRALPALAERWARRHGLWWDVRTKAERGQRLADAVEHVKPTKAAASPLVADADTRSAFAAMVLACLAHALPNLAEIADGAGEPEHLHQLRVGLRRLRSVLREFAPWCGDPERARRLEADWREPFARLGASRDVDAIAATLLPQLTAAGAPPLAAAAAETGAAAAPGEIVRSAEVNALLLRALAIAMPGVDADAKADARADAKADSRVHAEADDAAAAGPLVSAAVAPLRRAWRRALADVQHFERAEPAIQHRTRKRLKRLRYAFEFMLPLFPAKAGRRLQRALADAGEALGHMNDLHVASLAYEALIHSEPRAWFALGWLAAQRERAVADAARRLARLADTPRPWRSGRARG